MYRLVRPLLLRILRLPADAPSLPPGINAEGIKPARRLLFYQFLGWGIAFIGAIIGEIAVFFADRPVSAFGYTIDLPLAWLAFFPLRLAVILTIIAAIGKCLVLPLEHDMLYYIVTDRDIRLRHGGMTLWETTFSLSNIQNIRITQGPMERIFGISTLTVTTAGGGDSDDDDDHSSSHKGELRGLPDAAAMRDRIHALIRQRSSGLGNPDDPVDIDATPQLTGVLAEIRDDLHAVNARLA